MNPNRPNKRFWWQSANKILTPRRLSYAFITGAALWLAWLASLILGPGNFDLANQVVGTDYLQFYAAGVTLEQDNSDRLFDFNFQSDLELEIAGPELTNFHAFLNPPFLAWLFVPLSRLPYLWSFLAWSILSLSALYASIKMLGAEKPRRAFLWALTWFPIFATLSFGQNSLLSLLILSLTYWLWKSQRNFLAGLTASLILFKPQLIIGIAILWLLRWRKDWKAILGLMISGCILAGLTFTLLPKASADYLRLAIKFLPNMIYGDQFPLYHLHALRGFLILPFPGMTSLTEIAASLASLITLVLFIRFIINQKERLTICFAAAIAFTLIVTPHAMIYDWALLLIPAVLFWKELPEQKPYWKVVFTAVWLLTLLSGPLTYLQRQVLPLALQISVPGYILLLISVYRTLVNQGKTNIEAAASS